MNMRRRALSLLLAVVTAGSLAVFATATSGGASVAGAKAPACAGSTKKAAIKQINKAWDYFLNGAKGYTADQKAAYIQYLSGPKLNQDFLDKFRASSEANAADAASTGVRVDKVTCTGKKTADVAFTLVLGGTPTEGLAPPGTAILEGKTWKVTGETVCNLQALGDASVLETEPCATIVLGG
jgi:hypothetical protein